MGAEHIDLSRMVDRLNPDQVRALRAVAQQLLRPAAGPLRGLRVAARALNACLTRPDLRSSIPANKDQ